LFRTEALPDQVLSVADNVASLPAPRRVRTSSGTRTSDAGRTRNAPDGRPCREVEHLRDWLGQRGIPDEADVGQPELEAVVDVGGVELVEVAGQPAPTDCCRSLPDHSPDSG
jgi:hypothetical protein